MSVSPSAKSFFFRLHTSTLPAKVWLAERGMFVPWSTNCHWCRVPGTLDQCFISCKDAVRLLVPSPKGTGPGGVQSAGADSQKASDVRNSKQQQDFTVHNIQGEKSYT